MGLGPLHDDSLLRRLGRTKGVLDAWWIELEQMERTAARQQARLKYAAKHKAPVKPLAPVQQYDEKLAAGKERLWLWIGEDIPSKQLARDYYYTSGRIRTAGFKLPKLVKVKKEKRKAKDDTVTPD